jgi:hypothetical protein
MKTILAWSFYLMMQAGILQATILEASDIEEIKQARVL